MVTELFSSCFEFLNTLEFAAVKDSCGPNNKGSLSLVMESAEDHTNSISSDMISRYHQLPLELPCQIDIRFGDPKSLHSCQSTRDIDMKVNSCTESFAEKFLFADEELQDGIECLDSHRRSMSEECLKLAFQKSLNFDGGINDDNESHTADDHKLNDTVKDGAFSNNDWNSLINVDRELKYEVPKTQSPLDTTFPCSVQSDLDSLIERRDNSELIEDADVTVENSPRLDKSLCSRPASLLDNHAVDFKPLMDKFMLSRVSRWQISYNAESSFELVSAMRGGKEMNGLGPRPKLSVKWAPDVREPRSSSVSHTVKGHHHRTPRKKDYKHRNKGKSGQRYGNIKNDKRYHSRRASTSDISSSRFLTSLVYDKRMLSSSSNAEGLLSVNHDREETDTRVKISSGKFCIIKGNMLSPKFSDSECPASGFKCATRSVCTLQNKIMPYAEAA